MRITLPSGRELRLIFNRDPHPQTKKDQRKHRATRVAIVETHEDHSHILARAEVKAHPPDIFTREMGRVEALVKALLTGYTEGVFTLDEAVEITRAYDSRPRPQTSLPKAARQRPVCFQPQPMDDLNMEVFRQMEDARRQAVGA
jgi:hypothetical protein